MISLADDLLRRAVEYDRLMKLEDPTRQTVLRLMRDMWLELANDRSMSAQELGREVAAIEQIRCHFAIRQDNHAA